MSNEEKEFWTCPDCRQENFGASRYCELCGKERGSTKRGPGQGMMSRLGLRRGPAADIKDGDAASVDEPPRAAETRRMPEQPAAARPRRPAERAAADPPRGRTRGRSYEEDEWDESAEVDEETPRARLRYLSLSERILGMFRGPAAAPQRRGPRRRNPVTTLLVAFVIWMAVRLFGYAPLMLLLRFIAFLLTPAGLVVWLVMAWLYSRHHVAIHRFVGGVRDRVSGFVRLLGLAGNSIGWIRDRALGLLSFRRRPEERPCGQAVRGASVRFLEEDSDEDEYDERRH